MLESFISRVGHLHILYNLQFKFISVTKALFAEGLARSCCQMRLQGIGHCTHVRGDIDLLAQDEVRMGARPEGKHRPYQNLV